MWPASGTSASPAMAQSRYNDRDDRIDVGEIIAGALIIGGIAAVAGSAGRDRYDYRGGDYRYDDRRYSQSGYYGEPVYRDTRVWRGNDGRTYCRKKDGTTGLIIGGAAGALLGREVDGGRNRTLGTVLGAAAGALIGKEVAQGSRCR